MEKSIPKIFLEYSNNEDKSAKIYLFYNDIKIPLGEAVLPIEMHKMKSFYQHFEKKSFNLKVIDDINAPNYFKQIKEKVSDHYFTSNGAFNFCVLGINFEDNKFNAGFKAAISISREAMQTLSLVSSNEFKVIGDRKLFMLNVKQAKRVDTGNTLIHEKIISYIQETEQKKLKAPLSIQDNKNSEDYFKPPLISKQKNISDFNKDKNLNDFKNKEIIKNIKIKKNASPSLNKNVSKTSSYHSSNRYHGSTSNYNYDSSLDVLFMASFPELAPLYRPDSLLAWVLYFYNENNQEKLFMHDIEAIRNIRGFENVGSVSVTQGADNTYQVQIFSDEFKEKPIGILSCHGDNILLEDMKGNNTSICHVPETNGYISKTISFDGSESSLEVFPENDGTLKGNWTINGKNSAEIESSVVFGNELTPENIKIGEPMKIGLNDSFQDNHINKNTSYEFESPIYEIDTPQEDFTKRFEMPPPPPPPPPPDDNYQFNTSDPYSRSSFSM